MPELKELQGHFADHDNFQVLTVSLDDSSNAHDLMDVVVENGITYPILFVGAEDGWHDGNFDWAIDGVPAAFLINPEGNIVGRFRVTPRLTTTIEYLMQCREPVPSFGIEVSYHIQADGSYRVAVKAISPTHQPVQVSFSAAKVIRCYFEEVDGEWKQLDTIPEGKQFNSLKHMEIGDFTDLQLDFSFGEFCESIQYVDVPAVTDDDLHRVVFNAWMPFPGENGEVQGAGIIISSTSDFKPEPAEN